MGYCWCKTSNKTGLHLCRTWDILVLVISAGADVCAIDEEGRSILDVAVQSGLRTVWTEALKYCGIDIRDVVARPNFDLGHSTALSPQYREPPRSVTSNISLTEYLKRRRPVPKLGSDIERADRELSSSEEDESEDEDSFRETAKGTGTRKNIFIEGNEDIHGNYEESKAKKKAKLE